MEGLRGTGTKDVGSYLGMQQWQESLPSIPCSFLDKKNVWIIYGKGFSTPMDSETSYHLIEIYNIIMDNHRRWRSVHSCGTMCDMLKFKIKI